MDVFYNAWSLQFSVSHAGGAQPLLSSVNKQRFTFPVDQLRLGQREEAALRGHAAVAYGAQRSAGLVLFF
jgi:hypothetical protein